MRMENFNNLKSLVQKRTFVSYSTHLTSSRNPKREFVLVEKIKRKDLLKSFTHKPKWPKIKDDYMYIFSMFDLKAGFTAVLPYCIRSSRLLACLLRSIQSFNPEPLFRLASSSASSPLAVNLSCDYFAVRASN